MISDDGGDDENYGENSTDDDVCKCSCRILKARPSHKHLQTGYAEFHPSCILLEVGHGPLCELPVL